MKIVGLTGGMGSGKTTVARMFESLGVPVYYADEAAKRLMTESVSIRKALIELVGSEAYLEGRLNRSYIAQKIFNDPQLLAEVNAVVHPAVARDFEQWCDAQSASYVIKEAAILFENGSYTSNDLNILVVADEEERIRRVMTRDSIDREAVVVRLNHQWPDDKKMPLADVIIENKTLEDVLVKVREIDRNIRNNRPF